MYAYLYIIYLYYIYTHMYVYTYTEMEMRREAKWFAKKTQTEKKAVMEELGNKRKIFPISNNF